MNVARLNAEEVIRQALRDNLPLLIPPNLFQELGEVLRLIEPPLAAAIAQALENAELPARRSQSASEENSAPGT